MKTKMVLCAAFAALIASGCGEDQKKAPPPPPKPKAAESKPAPAVPTQQVTAKAAKFECRASPCLVKVTVSGDCVISLDNDPLHVVGIKDAEIEWTLAGNDYEFVADGIKFNNPGNQLHNNRPGAKKQQWSDRNSEKGEFKYSVKVKKTQGAACPEFDPVVVNEP